jgi:hypothetical protein
MRVVLGGEEVIKINYETWVKRDSICAMWSSEDCSHGYHWYIGLTNGMKFEITRGTFVELEREYKGNV